MSQVINQQEPLAIPAGEPIGHQGARVDIQQRPAVMVSGWVSVLALFVLGGAIYFAVQNQTGGWILALLILAFALIIAYPYIPGSESAAFKGVSIFIGLVFSLGSSAAISNLIAGYLMTYRRVFKGKGPVKAR